MVLSQGVRRLMGRRRAFLGILETYPTYTYSNNNCNYNNYYYNSKTVSSGRFISFGSQTHFTAKDECVLKKEKRFKKGDTVNLSQLLFTANRDYLVRYNDPRPVTAEQLAGKVIVLFFVPLPNLTNNGIAYRCALMDTYNDLKSNNCFEVVLVVVDDVPIFNQQQPGKICSDPSLEGKFDDICSQTPSWPAIPFSDITSRQRLKTKLGSVKLYDPKEVLIDSKGMVLDTYPQLLFQTYGSEAYPFSDKRISFLKSRDKTAFCQPSLTALLGSSGRDFVISNTGYKVPIYTLEDKVVALYFYEAGYSDDFYTVKLKMYYEELRKNNQNFEVVLLYLSDTRQTTNSTNEETFWKTFSTMPWLALPFKDSAHKKLRRLFGYPYGYLEEDESIMVPTLVIVGPRTEIIEPGLATILRGYDPNLFMREEFAKVERERVWEVKLEMLCSPETVFKRKDGSQVQFSQLAGMRIIFLFEGDYPEYDGFHFRKNLEEKYMNMKGTADEFEVIYFPNSNDKNGKRVADVPWLVSCSVELLPGCSAFLSFYGKSCNRYQSSFILAFDHDGSLVRRMICPQFGNTYFPFYADNGETEASDLFGNTYFPFYADDGETEASDLSCSDFCWGYWDTLYQGLLRKSRKQINFTGGDLLFCVYCGYQQARRF